ncbi:MAG TPA: hypothetical protein VK742_13040 [Candidatus Sulfotelmatobacter sp.]|jgi:hypothetical protein|nr:hypothetical protein [Candidatus Sulfotelmatobacter sp.]
MSRSILIVICDFLLLSLLTFSTDITKMADENTRPPTKVVVSTNAVPNAGADLAAVMKRALEEERQGREQLEQQLAQTRSAATQQQAQLATQEQQNQQLQTQAVFARTNAEELSRQLQAASAQAQAVQQQLASTETEAQHQSEMSAALKQQLNQLTQSNQTALSEKERLANQLQLAEVERQAAADRAALMQQEVQATRAENSKLTEGFKTLATNSSELTQEIRDNRMLAPNNIFSEFVSNRVDADMVASRPNYILGFGGDRPAKTKTVLVTDGTNIFAMCHVDETPLVLWDPGTDWDKLTGTLSTHGGQAGIHSLSFHQQDPRVVFLPITPAEANQLGVKAYRISADPYKFQDAVLIGADGSYYGECDFQMDLSTPEYLKLDHNLIKGLFGKFNPSSGDLVLSRGGELLGIMVNNTYCLSIHDFATSVTIPFNEDLRSRHTGATLAELYNRIFQLPIRLK